jgi:hypothetical protein
LLGFIFSHDIMGDDIISDSIKPVPTLEEKVDALAMQLSQLVNYVMLQNPSQLVPTVEEEVDEFLSHHEEESAGSAGDSKICLPKFTPPQIFDGTMKDTKSFIGSIILYIKGCEPEFRTTESKIVFALSYMQGGKTQFWRNEAISQIAQGHELFKSFQDFLGKLEAQFGDPNLKVTAVGKLKTMQ